MRLRYIPSVITLIAGSITCIISIIKQSEVLNSLKLLLLVLVIFYIIGCIARDIIVYTLMNDNYVEEPLVDEESTLKTAVDNTFEESEERSNGGKER